jgi:glucokinase
MLVVADVMSDFTGGAGFLAAAIAVGGFIAHIGPALSGRSEERVRQATVIGGSAGLGVAVLVIVLSAWPR